MQKQKSKTKPADKTAAPDTQSASEPNQRNTPDSKQQPAWHVIVLGALTCGVYLLFWGFKTWRDLKQEAERTTGAPGDDSPLAVFRSINPLLRTAGLCIPALNIYLLAVLTVGIANLNPDRNDFARRKPLVASGLVVGSFLGLVSLARLPGAFYFLSLLSAVPFAFAQHWLNKYWCSVESDKLFVRHAFSIGEMITIIVGAGLLGLVAAGMMIGIKPH